MRSSALSHPVFSLALWKGEEEGAARQGGGWVPGRREAGLRPLEVCPCFWGPVEGWESILPKRGQQLSKRGGRHRGELCSLQMVGEPVLPSYSLPVVVGFSGRCWVGTAGSGRCRLEPCCEFAAFFPARPQLPGEVRQPR